MTPNKTYLIAGANRGIGKALVTHLLQRPFTTVIAGVRDPSNPTSQALESISRAEGSKLIVVKIDSTNESDPGAAMKELQDDYGVTSLDIVIANAGISHSAAPVRNLPVEVAMEHFKINAVAPLVLFGAAAPLLQASKNNPNGPVFAAVSSAVGSLGGMEGQKAFPIDMSPYGASKTALNWLVRRLHFEEPWLTCFSIHPGLVQTDMAAELETRTGLPLKDFGAITPEQSSGGMLAVIDGATREMTSGTFKSFDGTDMPW